MKRQQKKKFKKLNELICKICENYGEVIHHVIPLSFEGTDAKVNMIILCEKCHGELHGHYKHKAQKEAFERNKNYFQDCIIDLRKVNHIIKRSMIGKKQT